MQRIIIILLAGICITSCMNHNLPLTFRDISLGEQYTKIPGVELTYNEGAIKRGVRVNEKLTVSDIQLQKISYTFYKDRLMEIWMFYNGYENYDALLKTLTGQYGMSLQGRSSALGIMSGAMKGDAHLVPERPTRTNSWYGNDVYMTLEYFEKDGALSIKYIPLVQEQMDNQKSKNILE